MCVWSVIMHCKALKIYNTIMQALYNVIFFFYERQMQGTASLCCKVCPQHLQSPCILWGVSEQTVKIKFPWAQAIWGWTVSPLRAWKLRLAEESEFDSNGSIPRAGGRSACSALTVTGFKWFPSPVFQGKPAGCEEQTATRSPTPRALSSNKTSKVCHKKKKKNTHSCLRHHHVLAVDMSE